MCIYILLLLYNNNEKNNARSQNINRNGYNNNDSNIHSFLAFALWWEYVADDCGLMIYIRFFGILFNGPQNLLEGEGMDSPQWSDPWSLIRKRVHERQVQLYRNSNRIHYRQLLSGSLPHHRSVHANINYDQALYANCLHACVTIYVIVPTKI